MHHFEDSLVLESDLKSKCGCQSVEFGLDFLHACGCLGDVTSHRHHEILVHDLLADIDDVDIGLGHYAADFGDDPHAVFSDHGQNAQWRIRGRRFSFIRSCHAGLPVGLLFGLERAGRPAEGEVGGFDAGHFDEYSGPIL